VAPSTRYPGRGALDLVLAVALVLPWAVIAFQGWLIYLLLRQHGRALVNQDELRDRLAAVERTLHPLTATQAAHDHGASPLPEGLALGSPAPEFALPDLDGYERRLQDFLGKPLLLIFFDPECGFCRQMAPRLGQLPEDGTRVLLVSQGDPAEHRRLAAEHGWRCDVVFQQGWDVSNRYQAAGTPTGYLVDARGRVASDLAIGADALLRLIPTDQAVPAGAERTGLTAETLHKRERAAGSRARAAGLAITTSRLDRDGLPAGTPAPDFRLPDLDGVERSLAEFRGRRMLLVFSDPGCGPCQALGPKLVGLHRAHCDDLAVVMISRGDLGANQAKAREHGFTFPVLLQKHWEISRRYAMFATPIGYLIDEHGIIARDVAVGAEAVLDLV